MKPELQAGTEQGQLNKDTEGRARKRGKERNKEIKQKEQKT